MTDEKVSTEELLEKLRAASETGAAVDDVLRTDERVLARITDGIYRQPASALRELIANAYDADATLVVIDCDVPRFNRITVRDNGSGMSDATLAHVLHHIGGSLKRTSLGAELEVASSKDVQLSPKGRKLIGRIGIGLFSVVQLTPHFQIITKTRGSRKRIVADVIMAAETVEQVAQRGTATDELMTGRVRIWHEEASDPDSQGTDIVLLDIRPQTKELLRSRARWQALSNAGEAMPSDWLPTAAVAPAFHIGGLNFENEEVIETAAVLPWEPGDDPAEKFRKLVGAVRAQAKSVSNPELKDVLDNYFQMLWTLALGLPLPYVGTHPFDTNPGEVELYAISNEKKGQPARLDEGQSGRSALGLTCPSEFEDPNFRIVVDGTALLRPIETSRAPIKTTTSIERDLLFFGKCKPDLSGVAEEFRGGPLDFEAYVYWSPKVVPKDHNGVLVRIKGASGTLFDRTFLGYQVAENTRLKQITAEIYVKEGLEGALNIDRESFNYANIHYQFLSRWLHGAIRQVANRHKAVSKVSSTGRNDARKERLAHALEVISDDIWNRRTQNEDETAPPLIFVDNVSHSEGVAGLVVSRRSVFKALGELKAPSREFEQRLAAIFQVLHAYGLLESLSPETQESLLSDIARVLSVEANNVG